VAESYFATVTCLPGAFVCITTDVLSPELIKLYSAEPNSLHTAQLLKLGEDRYMTSIFMKLFPRRRAVFLPEAVLHTGVPETTTILKSQRRRWCMSAFHNMFDNLFLPRLFLWTRVCLVYDLITTWFQVTFFLLIFYSIARTIIYGSTMDFISLAAGLGFILMTMFTAGIYSRWEVLRYVGHFMLMTPMLYLVIPISNAWNAGNVKWGKTRQVSSVASSAAGDALLADGNADGDKPQPDATLGVGRVVDDDDDDDVKGHQFNTRTPADCHSQRDQDLDDLAWDFEAEPTYAQRNLVRGAEPTGFAAAPRPPSTQDISATAMYSPSDPSLGLTSDVDYIANRQGSMVPLLGLPTSYNQRETLRPQAPTNGPPLTSAHDAMSYHEAGLTPPPPPALSSEAAPVRGILQTQSVRSAPAVPLQRQPSREDRLPTRPLRPGGFLDEDDGYDPRRAISRDDARSFKSGASEQRKVVLTSGVSFTDLLKARAAAAAASRQKQEAQAATATAANIPTFQPFRR
jgi:hypothetical protein